MRVCKVASWQQTLPFNVRSAFTVQCVLITLTASLQTLPASASLLKPGVAPSPIKGAATPAMTAGEQQFWSPLHAHKQASAVSSLPTSTSQTIDPRMLLQMSQWGAEGAVVVLSTSSRPAAKAPSAPLAPALAPSPAPFAPAPPPLALPASSAGSAPAALPMPYFGALANLPAPAPALALPGTPTGARHMGGHHPAPPQQKPSHTRGASVVSALGVEDMDDEWQELLLEVDGELAGRGQVGPGP